jgi:predicted nucleotidyltransferase
MRLVSSEIALQVLLALASAGNLTLSEISHATDAPTSSTKRALEILVEDGYAIRSRNSYSLDSAPTVDLLVRLSAELLEPTTVVRIAAQATGQVEFVGQDHDQMLVVFGRASDPMVESRLAVLLERQAERIGKKLHLRSHDEVRQEFDVDPERMYEYLALQPMFGDPHAAFPDRRLHGATEGDPLGRPNPLLRLPSIRSLHRFKRLHGIRTAKLFGSAVRTDFRPDSDVDIAIDLMGRPSLKVLIDIEQAFERLFGRDVDVILESNAKPTVRAAIEREGVEILR